jgi:hypothetical protein
VKTYVRANVPTLNLRFGNEVISTTSEHPFYVEGKGFVKAGELGEGNSIVTRAGPRLKLDKVVAQNAATVYNLNVEDFHTYFVGTSGLWVHNACFDPSELGDHYYRHGADFGATTMAEYAQQADNFLGGAKTGQTLERVRENGEIVRYNVITDEFGVIGPDGVIKSYFRPDPNRHGYASNLDYFNLSR